MWDLFDFNSDGKVSLEEEVIGIQLVEGTLFPEDEDSGEDEFDLDGEDDAGAEEEDDF